MNKKFEKGTYADLLRQIHKQPILLIIFLSVVLRVGAAFYLGNEVIELPGIFDQISYHNLALRVLDGHGFTFGELWWPVTQAGQPTAHWSFFYTLYLVLIYSLFGVHPLAARLLQAVIVGVLHLYIVWRLGEKLFGRNVGLIASGIIALYAYYIYYSAALMTEAFYITTILFSLYLAMEIADSRSTARDVRLGLALGLSIGITVILRQVFLLFIPFLLLWIWITRFKRDRTLPVVSTVLSVGIMILLILPISLYNQSRFGKFVLLNTNSGYAFFWGNHPIYGTKFIPILPTGTYQRLIPPEVRQLDEAALDRDLLNRGLQFIVQDPKRYILLSISRIPEYFKFWPSADSDLTSNISRVVSFGFTMPFMLYGLILWIRKTVNEREKGFLALLASPQVLLILFALVYSGVHILTWTLVRYRLPVDTVLIPFAGYALSDIAQRLSIKRLINHKI